ncbi:MAG: RNA polymerase sigma factor [Terracidiphilus sp.]
MRESQEMFAGSAKISEGLDPVTDFSREKRGGTKASFICNSDFDSTTREPHHWISKGGRGWITSPNGGRVEDLPSTIASTKAESNKDITEEKLDRFLQIVEQRRAQLLWQAQRFTNRRDDAEDIVQEAIFRAFKNLPHFRGEAKLDTWLHVIVRNVGREWLRKRKGRTDIPLEYVRNRDDEPIVFDFPDPGRNPEQCCESKEMEQILLSEIDDLSSVCMRAVVMCELKELSHLEAARILGTNVFTIKSRIFNGKRVLRRAICQRVGKRIHKRLGTEAHLCQ